MSEPAYAAESSRREKKPKSRTKTNDGSVKARNKEIAQAHGLTSRIEKNPAVTPWARPLTISAIAFVVLVAVTLRCLVSWEYFFAPIDPRHRNFEFCDSTYHIRRLEMALNDYPLITFHDSYHYYPEVPRIPWPPGYTLLLATIVKPFDLIFNSPLLNETVAGFVPIAVDTLTLLMVIVLVLPITGGPVAAVFAGMLYGLSQINIEYGGLGYIDHHYFITFMIMLLAHGIRIFSATPTKVVTVVLGILIGITSFFNVSAIQFSILSLCVLGFLVLQDPKTYGKPAANVAYLSVLVSSVVTMTTPVGWLFEIRYDETSWFQPVLLFCFAYGLRALSEVLPNGDSSFRESLSRFKPSLALSAQLPLLILAIFGVTKGVILGATFLWAGNILNGSQGEEASIVSYYPMAYKIYGIGFMFLPFGIMGAFRRRQQFPWFFALITAFFPIGAISALAHLCYAQFVFPWYAALVAIGVMDGTRILPRGVQWARGAIVIIVVGFSAFIAFKEEGNLSGEKNSTYKSLGQTVAAFHWLHEHSPTTSYHAKGNGKPEYSVFARRDYGHLILRHAERPVIVSPFSTPDYVEHMVDYSRFVLSIEERDVVKLLEKYDSQYLVVDNVDDSLIRFYLNILKVKDPQRYEMIKKSIKISAIPMLFRNRLLFFDGGQMGKFSSGRFRLVYEVPTVNEFTIQTKTGARKLPYNAMKIFQFVKGARIVKRGLSPRETATIIINLDSNGRNLTFRQRQVADDTGTVQFVVPYSTVGTSRERTSVLPVTSLAVITSATGESKVEITENSVVNGEEIIAN